MAVFTMMLLAAILPVAAAPPAVGHVTGIGGVFVRSPDPERLSAWYQDVLGVTLEPWGGAALRYDAPGHPPAAIWSAFPDKTDYFKPSAREFMLNLAVDDLDAILVRVKAKGVAVIDRQEDDNGRFASILDPDGTKIELWEPKR